MKTNDELIRKLNVAMDHSYNEDMIVALAVDADIRTVTDLLKELYDGRVAVFDAFGNYHVWGWNTDDEEPEWRLHITVNQKGELR